MSDNVSQAKSVLVLKGFSTYHSCSVPINVLIDELRDRETPHEAGRGLMCCIIHGFHNSREDLSDGTAHIRNSTRLQADCHGLTGGWLALQTRIGTWRCCKPHLFRRCRVTSLVGAPVAVN